MSKLPAITAEKLIKILEKDGFTFIRQKGSHRFYEKIIDGDKNYAHRETYLQSA